MEDEANQEHQKSLAAPLIFLIVAAFQCAYLWLDHLKKSGSDNEKEIQLRGEIKHLLKEASLLSQPSTFAQAAKLRRLAAAKEREIAKYQNLNHKDSTALYTKMLLASKYLTYGFLIIWFWRVPVAGISQQLVQPFGRFLSWKSGGVHSNDVMIGVISWLIVSARVCRFVRRAYSR
ncbi:protein GET1-like [Gastrolobium bilobum]|uniref:protein GET1-like n=1 Tax=Gastrolobium bilobum TaxID=150636 RepID=UPI002AB10B3D|nr:protein GET1-like [Gastrolobium bilobum]